MTTMDQRDDAADRTLENLRLVAAHLAHGGRDGTPTALAAASGPATGDRWKRWGPAGAAGLFLLGKAKVLLPFLKFANLGTLVSMLVAVWAYATIWGLPYALGFVALIFVHESGHALAMRQQGLRAGAPVFIPFVGAIIAMKDLPRNAHVEAVVGIGGPALGTLGAMVCLGVAWISGSLFWYALASTGFLINLFNLIPISPLDGGRIVGVISRWLWVAGYAVGIAVLVVTRSPLLFLILVVGLFSLGRARRGTGPDYFAVARGLRIRMAAAYFGLLALLAMGMWVAQHPLAHLHG
jgi:Zn-dependent protease